MRLGLSGINLREWLYTKRTFKRTMLLTVSGWVLAVFFAVAAVREPSPRLVSSLAYFALLFGFFVVFLRGNVRLEVEAKSGSGVLYLTAGVPVRTSILMKGMWEMAMGLLIIVPVGVVLTGGGVLALSPVALGHLVLAPLLLIAMTLVLTCLSYSPEGKESSGRLLSLMFLPALLYVPSFGLLSQMPIPIFDVLLPVANVFGGFSEWTDGRSPAAMRIPLGLAQLLVMLSLAEWAYMRMLRRTLN
jgi:hypothetical protein